MKIPYISRFLGVCIVTGILLMAWSCNTPGDPSVLAAIGNPYPEYCPVMGKKLDMAAIRDNADLYSEYGGKRYYFCCSSCKRKFESDPERWIKNPREPKTE